MRYANSCAPNWCETSRAASQNRGAGARRGWHATCSALASVARDGLALNRSAATGRAAPVRRGSFRSPRRWLAQRLYPRFIYSKGWLPGFFYASLSEPIDPRLDKLAQGLGVIVGKKAKYYPMDRIPAYGIRDQWLNRVLCIERGAVDGVPHATWLETGEEPMQLLSRWYGFSFTYPGCEIYEPPPA